MVRDAPPQVVVSYDENIPEEVLGGFREAVADDRLHLRIESRPTTPQAGLEWLVPTAVVIFLGKAYFDAFLKEAGKDHYHLLKSGISSLWRTLVSRDRKVNLRLLKSGGKVVEGKYSLALSVMAEAAEGYRFKLLLEDSVGEEDFNAVIAMFLDFLETYYADRLDPNLRKDLREGRVVGRTILIAYDAELGALRVIDPIPRKEKRS